MLLRDVDLPCPSRCGANITFLAMLHPAINPLMLTKVLYASEGLQTIKAVQHDKIDRTSDAIIANQVTFLDI